VNHPKPDPAALDLADVDWKISSYSGGGGNCVRVGRKDGYVLLGDDQNPDRLPHIFTPTEWRMFLLGAQDGEFDLR